MFAESGKLPLGDREKENIQESYKNLKKKEEKLLHPIIHRFIYINSRNNTMFGFYRHQNLIFIVDIWANVCSEALRQIHTRAQTNRHAHLHRRACMLIFTSAGDKLHKMWKKKFWKYNQTP